MCTPGGSKLFNVMIRDSCDDSQKCHVFGLSRFVANVFASLRISLTTLIIRSAPGFATETARLRGDFYILVLFNRRRSTLLGVFVRETGLAVAVSVG